jgi:site-specific recombinase XerD
MTIYAACARHAKAARLKVSDIDSQRMVVYIREGKGGKDRDVVLSPKGSERKSGTPVYLVILENPLPSR